MAERVCERGAVRNQTSQERVEAGAGRRQHAAAAAGRSLLGHIDQLFRLSVIGA